MLCTTQGTVTCPPNFGSFLLKTWGDVLDDATAAMRCGSYEFDGARIDVTSLHVMGT